MHFRSAESVRKIEKIQTRALRTLYNGFAITKLWNGTRTMEVRRLRKLELERFSRL